LLGFNTVEGGNIYLDGMNVNELDVDDIRHQINYVNQRTTLFNDTILNNMRYGNRATDEEVIDVLERHNLHRIFPDLSMLVEKNGVNVSMGMQKVIFLVRGLLKKCSLVILDEPFSSIDPVTRQNVLKLIDEMTKGKTLIVITHDMDGLESILDRFVTL